MVDKCSGCRKFFTLSNCSYIFCFLTPFLLSPLLLSPQKEAKCAFVILWMVVFWVLEPIHLTVTALMPVVLLPVLGISTSAEVAESYMKEVLMMFLGGLAVAAAVEHSRLHERIALNVLLILGSNTKRLMLGFMLPTMFLSMWISNTATTAMMVPIVDALMSELRKGVSTNEASIEKGSSLELPVLHKTLLLSVAYSANCGGTGTITGTSPNMVLKGLIEELYPQSTEVTYASWMMYNVPGMLLCVLFGWIVLQIVYIPFWRGQDLSMKSQVQAVIKRRYQELGTITFHEVAVLLLFIILVFLWVFREPKFVSGWASAIQTDTHIGDAVPVIAILFLLFLLPAEPSRLLESKRLLEWEVMNKKLPWGLVLLLGGGFALAHGTEKSGLSDWLGEQMTLFTSLSPFAIGIVLCVLTAVLTEVISNSTVATIFLPVVSKMALTFQVHPFYFMLPVTIASSYAFMLPVATGPNAIIFDTGHLVLVDMAKPGIIMNIIACCVQVLMINTLGVAVFHLDKFPSWANSTAVSPFENNINVTESAITEYSMTRF